MQTTLHVFVRKQKELIKEVYDQRRDNLAGGCAQSFENYNFHVGYIAGLKFVLDELDNLELDANQTAVGKD